MTFLQPLGEPRTLRFHARMGLFAADDAAEMLIGQIFRREVEKFRFHMHPRFQHGFNLRTFGALRLSKK